MFDLSVIARYAALACGARGHAVRLVHIEQMNERKNRLSVMRSQPLQRRPYDQRAIALLPHRVGILFSAGKNHRAGDPRTSREIERAVVIVKSLVHPKLALQKKTADERAGFVPMRPEHRGQRDRPRGNANGILLHSVLKWVGRCE